MNIPEGWSDPPDEMKESAANLFQMFTALCGSGFTEQQALAVIGHILSIANGGGS